MACGSCTSKCLSTYLSNSNEVFSFFRVMEGDFTSALEIPDKFAMRIKCRRCRDAILHGPSGYLWRVNLCYTNASASFTDGWHSFVSDNGVAAKDILVFSYVNDTYFVVQVFGPNYCEKQSASALQSYTSSCLKQETPPKVCNQKRCEHRKVPTKPSAAVHISFVEPTANHQIAVTTSTKHKEDFSMTAKCSSKELVCVPHKPENIISGTQASPFKKHPRSYNAVTEVIPCLDTDSISEIPGVLNPVVSVEAQFEVVLKKGAVFGKTCRIGIPAKFAKLWLPKANIRIILVHHKKPGIWPVMVRKNRKSLILVGGLKSFVVSNELHIHDICVFKLVNRVHHIFMVYVWSSRK
ncbi:hypothetical protein SUGI_1139080 [Cryptomeria japonica]|nr:hypothetical protein SUGI_1139080 [Cryptomeria japonica]